MTVKKTWPHKISAEFLKIIFRFWISIMFKGSCHIFLIFFILTLHWWDKFLTKKNYVKVIHFNSLFPIFWILIIIFETLSVVGVLVHVHVYLRPHRAFFSVVPFSLSVYQVFSVCDISMFSVHLSKFWGISPPSPLLQYIPTHSDVTTIRTKVLEGDKI